MKLKLKEIDKKWKEYALAGCVCILFFVCIMRLDAIWSAIVGFFRIIKPLFIGFVIAYIVNPIAKGLQNKLLAGIKKERISWAIASVLSLLIVLLLIVLLFASLIPQIGDNVSSLAENYLVYVEQLKRFMDSSQNPLAGTEVFQNLLDSFAAEDGLLSQIGMILKDNSKAIISTTASIGNAVVNWLIGIIFAVYFLLAKENISKMFSQLISLTFSPLKCERMKLLTEKFNTIFSKYIVCELLDSLIVSVLNYIFMQIFGMPSALLVSVVIGVTNLAPTFGPIIGAVIAVFLLLLIRPVSVIPFLIFTVILQSVDAYLIKPKLFGNALNVPGLIILIAIIVFGKLLGVPGMLIAIPAAAIIVYLYKESLIPWLELKRDLKQYRKEEEKDKKAETAAQ